MKVTRATVEDADTLAAMNKQLIADERHENPMTSAELADRMRGWLRADYAAFLFSAGESIAGYALIRMTDNPPYLRQFFIARELRRQGLGTAAFHALVEFISVEELGLDVLVWNTNAVAFWKSLGFTERSIHLRYRKS